MIDIILNSEALDLEAGQVVTVKRSQNLNGIQNQYSFSNNINLPITAKNKRLLKINYLPNSKAKSMTQGYDVDVVLFGCIFLKKQKLKVQKESDKSISVYLVFTDSFFLAKSKEKIVNDIDLQVTYDKSQLQFLQYNLIDAFLRTAPISAQDSSNLIAIEEIPPLLNLVELVKRIINGLDYDFSGSFFTDDKLKKWYVNPNYSIYKVGGKPLFDKSLTVFEFLINTLKTFNAYIDVSDSSKAVGIFLWNDIEKAKQTFLDYSDKFVSYKEYSFEGGLAKINTIGYSGSQPFYDSFFENNKSIIEKTDYLNSSFGAGTMRLFDDQELSETFTLPLRLVGEVCETSEVNLYKFEDQLTQVAYYVNGNRNLSQMYKAYTPNILEIFNDFHFKYVKNIKLPTIANLKFRYDAIFLSELKLQNVFFVKQLSTYWLPLELNYSTKKEEVTMKCLMIESTAADVPIVFDLNISLGFNENYTIADASPLYSSQNASAQSIFTVVNFNQSKNRVYVTGNNGIRTQILATPVNIDIATMFKLEFENNDPINQIDSSDFLFQFTSEEGGVSRIAKINVTHNGRAKFVSNYRLDVTPTSYGIPQIPFFQAWSNFAEKIISVANITSTLDVTLGATGDFNTAVQNFKMIRLQRAGTLIIDFEVQATYYFNKNNLRASLELIYQVVKNGVPIYNINSKGAIIGTDTFEYTIYDNETKQFTVNGNANDEFSIIIQITGDTPGSGGDLSGLLTWQKLNYKYTINEQL